MTLTTLLPPLSSQSELTLLSSTLFSVGLLSTADHVRGPLVRAGSRAGSRFQFSTSEFRPGEAGAGPGHWRPVRRAGPAETRGPGTRGHSDNHDDSHGDTHASDKRGQLAIKENGKISILALVY